MSYVEGFCFAVLVAGMCFGLLQYVKFMRYAMEQKQKAAEATKPAEPPAGDTHDGYEFREIPPAPDSLPGSYMPPQPEPAKPQVNEVEEFYARERRAFEQRQELITAEVALANQRAQHLMVTKGVAVLLTIKDPAGVPEGEAICEVRELLEDEPGYGICALKVVDHRPATPPVWLPPHAREAYEYKEKKRQEALSDEGRDKIEADIRDAKAYSEKIRQTARKDFEELIPEIRADAEKLAREKFVPNRAAQINAEASERGCDPKVVIEEFVSEVVEQAVAAARRRYATTQPLTNDMFMRAVDAGGWQR